MQLSIPCPITKATYSDQTYLFDLYERIQCIDAGIWDKFSGGYFSSHTYLSFLEKTTENSVSFRYVLIKRNGELCGLAIYQLVTFEGAQLINYFPEKAETLWWGKLLKPIIQKITAGIRVPLLVSGNVFMTGAPGFHPPADLNPQERAALFHDVSQFILDKDRSIKAVLIPDLYEKDKNFSEALLLKSYRLLLEEPDMILKLSEHWKSFDHYLSDFSSKYRVRCKKALNSSHSLVCRNLNFSEIQNHTPEIYGLYKNVMDQVDFKLAVLPAAYFASQKESEPERYQLWAYFYEEKMVGFISAFRQGSGLEIHYTGIDYRLNKALCLYQRMLYDMVRYGIENGHNRLHFGRTAQEIKSTIGARPLPTHGLLRHRNPLFNFVMKWITSLLRSKDFVFRSPFREIDQPA